MKSVPALLRICLTMAFPMSVLAPVARAQSMFSFTNPSLTVAQPTEADYDAGFSAASRNYFLITTCTGSGNQGCRLFLQYGSNPQGQQVDMQYAVVSASGGCRGVAADPNSWFPVQTSVPVLSTQKNRICFVNFRFRVSPLSWTTYTAPGPISGAYLQRVSFRLTRP